jgi:hypothetical protein
MKTARLGLRSLALAAILSLGLTPTVALADPGGDSASGHVTDLYNQSYDFSAKSSAAGTGASGYGKVTLVYSDPDQVYSGDVTCLRVIGATLTTPATAVIGVRVTNAPIGSTTQSLLIQATDSGKFAAAPDTIFSQSYATPAPPDGACPAAVPFAGYPVIKGDITINNTLP